MDILISILKAKRDRIDMLFGKTNAAGNKSMKIMPLLYTSRPLLNCKLLQGDILTF